jgi:chromosome transmission fidelity protein 4
MHTQSTQCKGGLLPAKNPEKPVPPRCGKGARAAGMSGGKDLTRRLAHNAGFCSLAYAPAAKDRVLVTCGNDDLVKLHDLEKGRDEEGGVNEVDHFDDSLYAVAVSPDGTRIAAGGEGKVAVLFKVEDGGADYERNATKATLPIRDLCFSPDGAQLAVASDDDEIKVVHVENKEEVVALRGHEGGVKSVAFDPQGEYLASAGSDRSVRIWLLETGTEFKKLSQVYGKVPATDVEDGNPINLCQLAWSPDGRFLAVAGSKDVKIFERGSFKEVDSCAGAHEHEVSIVQFSSNGLYLLSVDITGLIVIWDFVLRESLQRYKNGSRVLAAKWDPFSNTIAAISIKGEYGLIDDVVPDSKPGPNDKRDDEDMNSEIAQEDDNGLEAAGGVQWEDEPELDARGGFAVTRRERPQPAFQPQVPCLLVRRRILPISRRILQNAT